MVSLNKISTATFLSAPGIREITGSSFVSEYYPEINISREMFNTSSSRCPDSYQHQSLILPVNEHVLKKISRTYFEYGLHVALDEATSPQTSLSNPIISSIAGFMLKCLNVCNNLTSLILPHLGEQGTLCIDKFSQTRDWSKSCIRVIVWHPNCFKIAVAGSDDIIRVYKDEPAVVPVLKYITQRSISSMAWRPYSASELAVGCSNGICYWTLPASQAVMLRAANHFPVTSVEWSAEGQLLASSSINDPNILLWNVDKLESAPLKRVGPPCSFLKWSPDGSYLFSSTIGNVFRVWFKDSEWKPDRWTINSGTIQSAAWSPCGSFLLFITSEESILYRLQFIEEQLFRSNSVSKEAVPVADLSKITLGSKEIGGQPHSIAWDGNYLAVTFKDTACVCIFGTSISKYNLSLNPSYFVAGVAIEYPSVICYQSKNRRNSDSLLTIGWSSGRIQYLPLINM